jgi:hypothetical protein
MPMLRVASINLLLNKVRDEFFSACLYLYIIPCIVQRPACCKPLVNTVLAKLFRL